MPKNILLFSDGTGNSSAKAEKTNVWRLFQALDQTQTDQLAMYDDGVGTSSNKYLAALGGAFGWGLKRNVIDLYRFVCRTYEPGDRIYGFGFSRGAFTIRVLVGLIAREGLVSFRSEEELIRNSVAAYRQYRTKSFPSHSPIVWGCRKLRNALLWLKDRIKGYRPYDQVAEDTKKLDRHIIPIHFLGLWDTVEAYGLPVEELKRGIDKVLWPMVFGDMVLSPRVRRACHALSLDDQRTTFHPLLWDQVAEARMVEAKLVEPGRITQVWFAGVHSNVGGGYPEDQLALVTLDWMMGEAIANDVELAPHAVEQVAAAKSSFAKLYDSRSGIAAYYRYSPRRIEPIFDQHQVPILPIVHSSVLMRMAYGSDGYAPITLPHEFWVLAPDGKLLPMAAPATSLNIDQSKSQQATTGKPADSVSQQSEQLDKAIAVLARPDRPAIRLVWDTVFWRRCLYVLTVVLTVMLLAFPKSSNMVEHLPFIGKFAAKDVTTINDTARWSVTTAVNTFSGLIPEFARPWKEALIQHPLEFFILVLSIVACMAGSTVLEHRIHDRARVAWHHGYRDEYEKWMIESGKGFRNGTFAVLALTLLGLLVAWFDHREGTVQGYLIAVAVLLLVLLLQKLGRREVSDSNSRKIRSTLALTIARKLRDNRPLEWLYELLTKKIIPYLFAAVIVIAGLLLANRALFDVANSAGAFCTGSKNPDTRQEKSRSAVGEFSTNSMCWNSGLVLQQGNRYRITLKVTSGWTDVSVDTDVEGFPAPSTKFRAFTPLKRWWQQNWLKPIARIGELGNDEYILDSVTKNAKDPANTPGVLISDIEARTTGELFLYLNDAVVAIPWLTDFFEKNNQGSAEVTVSEPPSRN
ncbi:MAG: DUF2235 domain-containing protein [Steroidobacteraceae bacterium]